MEVNKKQVCALLFTIIPSSKFLVLPTLYAAYAKQDAWFAGLINLIADGILVAVIVAFISVYEGQTFFDVLENTFNKKVARAVYFVYGLYFMFKCVVPVFEQKNYTEIVLYETSPTVFTFLPFFLVSAYMCVHGLRPMARTAEIVAWFTATGLVLVTFLSVSSVDFLYLRPVLKNPVGQTLSGSYKAMIWYGQPVVLLFMAGKIKKEKHFKLSVGITFGVAAAIVVLLFAFFTGIYGDIAVRQLYALSKMTKYSIALNNVGRFDYIATLMLVTAGVLSLSVPLVFSTMCFNTAFGKGKPFVFAIIINALIATVLSIFNLYFNRTIELFENYFSPVMLLLVYVFPLVMLIIGKKRRVEKNDFNESKLREKSAIMREKGDL